MDFSFSPPSRDGSSQFLPSSPQLSSSVSCIHSPAPSNGNDISWANASGALEKLAQHLVAAEGFEKETELEIDERLHHRYNELKIHSLR